MERLNVKLIDVLKPIFSEGEDGLPDMTGGVKLYARCCWGHDTVVVGLNSKMFKAKCSNESKWDIAFIKKRTGVFSKGYWTHQLAAAAAY